MVSNKCLIICTYKCVWIYVPYVFQFPYKIWAKFMEDKYDFHF